MSEPIFARRSLTVFAALLLAGLAVLSAMAAWDRAHRSTLEVLTEPSALGDPVVFTVPDEGSEVSVQIQGVRMVVERPIERNDGLMYKSGYDDTGTIPVYRRMRGGRLQSTYYLRTAPGQYLILKPAS